MTLSLANLAARAIRLFEPETAHRLTIRLLQSGLAPRRPAPDDPVLRCVRWGRTFASPVGLAAGFDKNAEVPDAMLRFGFGFVETGSVTPRPQAGNPKPRLFRLPAQRAVINRMGFNNDGIEAVRERLAKRQGRPGIVGANLGANKDSDDRIADYVEGTRALAPMVDYLVVNVSSPNTPGLRGLQTEDSLRDLIGRVRAARNAAIPDTSRQPPVLVKIAPDFTNDDLDAVAATLLDLAVDGIIVSNTTVGMRDRLTGPNAGETGGLSGKPLFDLSTRCLSRVYRATGGQVPLIGVGGVDSGDAAYAKIRAGASLVQLYTALVFHGPGLVRQISDDLAALLRRDGFTHLDEAVGTDLG